MRESFLEILKYIGQNLLWVFVGFSFGLAAYWYKLGQLKNEFKSLCHLLFKKYRRGQEFTIKAGVDLKSLDGSSEKMISSDMQMCFGYERGVDWFFCFNY